jgi:hypothetical protein
MAGPSTSQWNTTDYDEHLYNLMTGQCLTLDPPEGLAPATDYVDQTTCGYPQPSDFGNHLPTVHDQLQPQYSGLLDLGGSFPNLVESGTSAALPTPSNGENLPILKRRGDKY